MTRVRIETSALTGWAKILLYERIPANVSDPAAMTKAQALAEEFSDTHPWARAQGAKFDLDELVSVVVPWARSKGYDLLDEPPGVYAPAPTEWIRCWGPSQ